MRTRFSPADSPKKGEADEGRAVARLSERALLGNYHAIAEQVPGQAILPMLKANAYGHGAAWAARTLAHEKNLYALGAATLEEGAEIRRALDSARKRAAVIVFSGTTPWTEEKGRFCEKHGLSATIANDEDWHSFLKGGWAERIAYELKFNTGMNRLGLSPGLARAIGRTLSPRGRGVGHHPRGVMSHLAMGESPEEKLSRRQLELFKSIRAELSGALPSAHFHLANSAAIWKARAWGLGELTDVVRPGISLYGVPPWSGAPARGLEPVLTFRARVIARHRLKPGESTGYGARFKATGKNPVDIAIVSAGYADGVHRALSDRGQVWVGERHEKMIGIVSMDLCAVSCSAKVKVGDWAEILGANIASWEQAEAAQTIPYELLTSISPRVTRVYS
jgi:alanine racemase